MKVVLAPLLKPMRCATESKRKGDATRICTDTIIITHEINFKVPCCICTHPRKTGAMKIPEALTESPSVIMRAPIRGLFMTIMASVSTAYNSKKESLNR